MPDVIGRTITAIKRIDPDLLDEDWDWPIEGLVLDDGTFIYALSDDEGNGIGTLVKRHMGHTHYLE